MKKKWIVCGILVGLAFVTGCVQENIEDEIINDEPSETDNENILLVTGEYPPFCNETAEGQGFATEIITAAFEAVDIAIEYEFTSWSRCEGMVQQGAAFAAFPYYHTEKRAEKYNYSDGIIRDAPEMLFYYNKNETDFIFNEINDLKNYEVGGIRGYYYLEVFDNYSIAYETAENEVTAIRQLKEERFELLPMNELVGWYTIQNEFEDEVGEKFGTLKNPLLPGETYYLIVSRNYTNNREFLLKFNEGLQKIISNGTYDQILEQHDKEKYSIIYEG